jgi:SAM-dependent methyltransferase
MATDTIESEFDAYAQAYEDALNQGLSVSGESSDYFAKERIKWTASLVGSDIDSVIDFGCGVGIAIPTLKSCFDPSLIWGYDPSSAAIERAVKEHGDETTQFSFDSAQIPKSSFQLAYCNGVFHHIPPAQRQAAFSIVLQSLKPGGRFAFWENNPWNPGTRYVMSKIPFDKDAITITPPEARKLLIQAGFEIVVSHSRFIFPKSLSALRPLEKLVYRLPVGAQYLILAQKPE